MKGILMKDLLTIRKTALYYLAFLAVFVFYSSSAALMIALLYATMLSVNLVAFEERSRFDRFSLMLPVLPVQYVFSKYLITWMGMGIVAAVFVVSSFVHGTAIFEVVPACTIILLINSLMLPLIFAFGVEKGRLVYTICILGQMAVLKAVLDSGIAADAAMNWLLMLGGAALLAAGSVFVSAKVYVRRMTA